MGCGARPATGGTSALAETVPVAAEDGDGIVAAARRLRFDLVVIGPEAPLAAGLADRLRAAGQLVFGPSRAASRIESSKAWAKALMQEQGVPTARAVVVSDLAAGVAALADFAPPVVIKADGLAAGKGVIVAPDRATAADALHAFLERDALGVAGRRVVIEECLSGREVSVLYLTDGVTAYPLTAASDYKRAFANDEGPNTGGMGSYAPSPLVDAALLETLRTEVVEPTLAALAGREAPLQGVLYVGLMLTAAGPKVLEFNARFGDPETQVILPLLDGDLPDLLAAAAEGRLAGVPPPRAAGGAAVGVVLASGGYPGPYPMGVPIHGLDEGADEALIFQAGTRREDDGRLVTAGGRVVTVVGRGVDLGAARERAYAAAERITFEGRQVRPDIALRIAGSAGSRG